MKIRNNKVLRVSWLMIIAMILNIFSISSEVEAREVKENKLYINFSLRSPQEPGENITITCGKDGEYLEGYYSYYVKELGGDYKALLEDTGKHEIVWSPKEKGKYVIRVVLKYGDESFVTEKAFEITEEKKGEIKSIGVKDGDVIKLNDKFPITLNFPSECDTTYENIYNSNYNIKCYFNNTEIPILYEGVRTDRSEVSYLVDLGLGMLAIEDFYGTFKVELINKAENKIEDLKEVNIGIDNIGVRHQLIANEEGVVGKPININFIPQVSGIKDAKYSFYYMEAETGVKYPIVENIDSNTVDFIPNKAGKYVVSGKINKEIQSRTVYRTINVKEKEEDPSDVNKDSDFNDLEVSYKNGKNSIYKGKELEINATLVGGKEEYSKYIYIKGPNSEDYELVKDKYIPKDSGQYKVRAEFVYKEKIYTIEDSFYAKDIPSYTNHMNMYSGKINSYFSGDKIFINEVFNGDFVIEESDYSKGTDKECTMILYNSKDEVIRTENFISEYSNFHLGLLRVTEPGEYRLDVEIKNKEIENADIVKESYPIKVECRPLENMNLDFDKKVGNVNEEIGILGLFDRINEKDSLFSFYVRKVGETEYKPIVEKSTSSVLNFLPTEEGKYEFKFVIHEKYKDYEVEGASIDVIYEREDVDHDGRITIKDMSLIAEKYNTVKASKEWEEVYDINNDDVIDIYDIVRISSKLD
ncbi:dockerin type I domain-containing protein [Clostridium paraputrificum]|uniref:dockerin type I domain-containing protein n=1 Tax=Clostridium paraputrificum TaxID=29363 RepID=UPI003D34D713